MFILWGFTIRGRGLSSTLLVPSGKYTACLSFGGFYFTYLWMFCVCMHACMYACMYVCMCMCVYMLQNLIKYLQWAAPSWTIYGARPKGTGHARPVMHLWLLLWLYSNIVYPYPILFAIDPLASAYLLVATRFSLSLSVIDTVSSFSCS